MHLLIFATSMVSFERVFEVIDLPTEIKEIKNPIEVAEINGKISFTNVFIQIQQ